MNFCSDNVTGAAPEILEALGRAAQGAAMPYGEDALTKSVERRFNEIFEREVAVFLVATGSAANALALSCLTPPFGAIYSHPSAHVAVDECGAPEFYSGGAKLVGVQGAHGKIAPADLDGVLAASGRGVVHHVQAAAVSLSQATEAGTIYRPGEVAAIAEVGRRHGVRLHMDGARFTNALVTQNASPADLTWRAGVDALSFGASKNGAMAAEAVVFFDKALAAGMPYRRKRGGHLFSKMRFLAAQFDAYFTDDLWLSHARHANAQATRLAEGLARLPGVELLHPVEANELFVVLAEPVIAGLEQAGFKFYRWIEEGANVIRLVTAFNTDPAHVTEFLKTAERLARG
ncbi:MAG TPA: low specificity L-threonine aldolase [Alphaproteobacteria bacterium]|nr:low specificity L-threonine aldolase [Alphaproteobacteria bacterium]